MDKGLLEFAGQLGTVSDLGLQDLHLGDDGQSVAAVLVWYYLRDESG